MRRYMGKCEVEMEEEEEEVVDSKIRTPAADVMAEGKRTMKMTTKRKLSAAPTTPYNVHEVRTRRKRNAPPPPSSPASYRTETTTFEDDVTNCTSSSGAGSEVIASSSDFPAASCSSSNHASPSPSQSSSSSSSSDFLKKRAATATTTTSAEIVADPEIGESGGEASSKFVECNKSSTTRGEEEEDGLDYSGRKSTVQIKQVMMPSESEIEDFFSSAEKDLHKRFSDKYNFDIVKDVPLEGRYEWAQIKP